MKIETVFIDFKNLGVKASINKVDFDPATHTLWGSESVEASKAPLAEKPAAVPVETAAGKPWEAPIRKGKGKA